MLANEAYNRSKPRRSKILPSDENRKGERSQSPLKADESFHVAGQPKLETNELSPIAMRTNDPQRHIKNQVDGFPHSRNVNQHLLQKPSNQLKPQQDHDIKAMEPIQTGNYRITQSYEPKHDKNFYPK